MSTRDILRRAARRVLASDSTSLTDLFAAAREISPDFDPRSALRGMRLGNMDFAGVDLAGFDFSGCDLSNVDFSDASNVAQAIFRDITYVNGAPAMPGGRLVEAYITQTSVLDEISGWAKHLEKRLSGSSTGNGPGLDIDRFYDVMSRRLPLLADASDHPEAAFKAIDGALHSVSLTDQEVIRVLQSLPRLSLEQLQDLDKIFTEETEKFKKLAEDHCDDVFRLLLKMRGHSHDYLGAVAARQFSDGPVAPLYQALRDADRDGAVLRELHFAADDKRPDAQRATHFNTAIEALRAQDATAPLLSEVHSWEETVIDKLLRSTSSQIKKADASAIDQHVTDLAALTQEYRDGAHKDRILRQTSNWLLDANLPHNAAAFLEASGTDLYDTECEDLLIPRIRFLMLEGDYATATQLAARHTPTPSEGMSQKDAEQYLWLQRQQIICLNRLGKPTEAIELLEATFASAAHLPDTAYCNTCLKHIRIDSTELYIHAERFDKARELACELSDATSANTTYSIVMPLLAWISGGDVEPAIDAIRRAGQRGARSKVTWDFEDLRLALPHIPDDRRNIARDIIRFMTKTHRVSAPRLIQALRDWDTKQSASSRS